ncbi:hypothetical protein ACTOV4_23500 [Brucella sp. C7-11G]
MPTSNENPATGGNRSQGHSSTLTTEAYQNASHAYKLLRASPAFDERQFMLCEEDRFIQTHGITYAELLEIRRDARKAEAASALRVLDQWREAILFHETMTLAEKVAALAVGVFVNHSHMYCWPSQEGLAKRLGLSRGPTLGKKLRRSFEVGALTPMTVKHLPDGLRKLAVEKSRRSLRGQAYRLNPVENWAAESAQFTSVQNGPMFRDGTLQRSVAGDLNSQGNPKEPSAQDVSHPYGASPATLMAAATYQNGY